MWSKPRVQSAGGSKGSSTEKGHGGEPTSKPAGGQTSPPLLPACQAPTDQGDELTGWWMVVVPH
ncbi:hypothetical protein ACJ73_06296 [Blastomyces percursus]|uniref:Uncharacterized protein n=1 Tax=Blastomyces percursus TaxID=1658174 RepID=A0A1J9Q1A5_9EURO|nr:hypothetical protein ACJ73_06296 [Blastomyces percursus]